jgi:hypothetical protein
MSAAPILSFSEFKERFYSRFPSLDVFDCEGINLVKIVLEGLKVNYASRGKINHYMNKSVSWYTAMLTARRTKNFISGKGKSKEGLSALEKLASRPFLFVDHSVRMTMGPDGIPVSLYFHDVVKKIGRENVALLNENHPPAGSDFDFIVGHYSEYLKFRPLDHHEKKFRKQLIAFYKKICPLFNAEEQIDIGFSIEKFFSEYRIWRYILKILPQKKIVIMCHYHHEGTIHAMREAGREIIETQHGLISDQDIFYCLPAAIIPVRKKALFPDLMLVYGEYWKHVLLKGNEFTNEQIQVIGYYLYEKKQEESEQIVQLKEWMGNKKVILVTTQTFLHESFVKYVKWLSQDIQNRNLNYVIIVKTHPSEKHGLYSELETEECVKIVNEPLPSLFAITDMHVSIYSTTLYEGLRFGLKSYSLDVEPALSGYVNEIVNEGIAVRISGNTNPADLERIEQGTKDKKYYFDTFDAEKLISFLK